MKPAIRFIAAALISGAVFATTAPPASADRLRRYTAAKPRSSHKH